MTDQPPADPRADLERRVEELSAEVADLRAERDRALRARDSLVRELLGGAPAPRGEPSRRVWSALLGLLLLGALAVVVLHAVRLGRQLALLRREDPSRVLRGPGAPRVAPPRVPAGLSTGTSVPASSISRRRLVTIPFPELGLLTRAAYAPRRGLLAIGSAEGAIALYDLARDRLLGTIRAHTGEVRDLAFVADEGSLVSGGSEGAVRVWSASGGGRLRELRARGPAVRRLALAPGLVAVAAEQEAVELFPLGGGPPRRLEGGPGWTRAVAVCGEGRRLAVAGHAGVIHVFDLGPSGMSTELSRAWTLSGTRAWITSLACDGRGKLLASGGLDNKVRLWDLERGALIRTLDGHVLGVTDLAFDRRGERLVSASGDRTARVYSLAALAAAPLSGGRLARGADRPVVLEGHRFQLTWATFGVDAREVLTVSSDGTLRRWPLPLPVPPVLAPLGPPGPGEITLRRHQSGERLRVRVVDERGEPLEQGREELARLLRSGPDDRAQPPAAELVRLLFEVAEHFGRDKEITVISGYRSPEYNALRAQQSRQVGKESQHLEGTALDFRIEGVSLRTLHRHVSGLKRGGVGLYPESKFLHMDTGRVRHWEGD